jgi:sec-independent protein translocase protein TatC
MKRVRRLGYGEEATLVEHLEELRGRVIIVLCALGVTTAVAFAFNTHILAWLNHALPADKRQPVTFGVTEPFTTALTVSIYAGILLALPVLLWQLWAFFAPAVEEHHRHTVMVLVAVATVLGLTGLMFGYFILLPRAVHWLTNFDSHQFKILIRARDYYSFTSTVLLGIVVVFELPMVVLGLVRLGVLSSARLRKNRRLGYFIVAVIALGLPGPDPITTALELLPMWALFEGSIWAAVLVERRTPRVSATETP